MKAKFLPPYGDFSGNLLWNADERAGKEAQITKSIETLTALGYWASPFPEGDGVTFSGKDQEITPEQMLVHLRTAFSWLEIESAVSSDGNTELAELAPNREIRCKIIVPLAKILIEESFDIGDYHFVCRREFDPYPHERLGMFDCEYLEFDATLSYPDLLRINRKLEYNDLVINKCLALAEHAMDIIRFQFSSFIRPEFTPNPAGQLDDGFYAIEIIPDGNTHLRPLALEGIARPMSASNNWLGPQVEDSRQQGGELMIALAGRDDEVGMGVKSALRGCRQSFYAMGDESKFLNLVFTLDGLAHPGPLIGWKHRTYMAALISHGHILQFASVLRRYDELYTEVRNKLVHGGKDFYELLFEPHQACEDIYEYIKAVIQLIESQGFSKAEDLRDYAKEFLIQPEFKLAYMKLVNEICSQRGTTAPNSVW